MKNNTVYLSLIVLLLLAGVLVSAGAAAPPIKRLATPQLMTPKNGASFTLGDPIPFAWKAVPGATQYYIEIEKATIIDKNTISWAFEEAGYRTDPYLGGEANIAGYIRWRVTAIASNSLLNSNPSNWRTISIVV